MDLGRWIALVLLLGLGLMFIRTASPGTVDPWSMQEDAAVAVPVPAEPDAIEQSFAPRSPRLSVIQVRASFSRDLAHSSGQMTLRLRALHQEQPDLVSISVPLALLRNNELVSFSFPPLDRADHEPLLMRLSVSAADAGPVSVWASAEDIFPDGQLTVNGVGTERDLAFRAYSALDAPALLAELARTLDRFKWGILFALFLLLIPGLALSFFMPGIPAYLVITLAGATSLALGSTAAIFFLWLPFTFDSLTLRVVLALLGLGLGIKLWSMRRKWARPNRSNVVLIALATLAFATALLEIRDVPVPLWVDSPLHAGFISSLLDQGRLPVDIFYHQGFHTLTAVLVRLAGISTPDAMLVLGQLLIVQAGLGAFLLARRLIGSSEAGIAAAVGVWFLSPTPSYFISWGRYPLLAGSALLPVALYFAIDLIESPRMSRVTLAFATLTLTGLAFAHIRLVAFYAVFIGVYVFFMVWERRQLGIRYGTLLRRIGMVVGGGMVFALLWLLFLFARGLSGPAIQARNMLASSLDLESALTVSFSHRGVEFWLVVLAGVIFGLILRRRVTLLGLAWYGALFLFALVPMDLAGGQYLSPGLVVLMAFLPGACVMGDLAHLVWTTRKLTVQMRTTLVLCLLLAAPLGAREMVAIVNPATRLTSGADLQAMKWIQANTPTEARFLTNSFRWANDVYSPSDGGAWIPYLTGRSVEYLDAVTQPVMGDKEAFGDWLAEHRITFIYFGWRAGIMHRSDFACDDVRYTRVYRRDGVEIYQVTGDSGGRPQAQSPDCGLVGFNINSPIANRPD